MKIAVDGPSSASLLSIVSAVERALFHIEHFLDLHQGTSPGEEQFILPSLETRAGWDFKPPAFWLGSCTLDGSTVALSFSDTEGTDLVSQDCLSIVSIPPTDVLVANTTITTSVIVVIAILIAVVIAIPIAVVVAIPIPIVVAIPIAVIIAITIVVVVIISIVGTVVVVGIVGTIVVISIVGTVAIVSIAGTVGTIVTASIRK